MRRMAVKVDSDISGFEAGMEKVRQQASRMSNAVTGSIGGRIAGWFALGAIEETIRKTAEYAGQLTDMSSRTGVAVETLQRLDRAAKENGTSLDALVNFWERIGNAREDALRKPGSDAAKAFGALGVNREQLKTDSPEKIMRTIALAFENSTDVEKLIAPLRDIGGRGAGQMIALFRAGLDQQYQDMQVMSAAQADVLDELDDKWSTLSQRISIGVAPALVKVIDAFTWLQDKLVSVFTALGVEHYGRDIGMSDAEAEKSGKAAYAQSEAENASDREAEAKARAEKIKRRLQFGNADYSSIMPDAKKAKAEKFSIRELALDELSKAGLFAGGAGTGNASIPERQLEALEEIADTTKRTSDILDEAL